MDAAVYHQRWMSETGFSLLKQDDGEKLRSWSWHGQFRELTRKCIVHNLSQAASYIVCRKSLCNRGPDSA